MFARHFIDRSCQARTSGRFPRERGFTLVEILIALVIIQVGLLSLLAVIPLSQVQVSRAGLRSQAVQLARQGLEDLTRRAFADTLLNAGSYSDPDNPINERFSRSWEVVDDTPVAGCKTVTVTVTWPEGDDVRAVETQTVKAQF